MPTFKFKLGEKVMANIAAPRNAESFGSLRLYTVVQRRHIEESTGCARTYILRPVDVRDGTIYPAIEIEEESLKSFEEYNAALKKDE